MVLIKRIWKISNAKNTKSPHEFAPNLNYSFLKRDAKTAASTALSEAYAPIIFSFRIPHGVLKLDKFNQNGV